MKKILFITSICLVSACANNTNSSNSKQNLAKNPNVPGATQGDLGRANIACVERHGQLVSRRGGGVICKLPNGKIVDQMTLI